MKYGLLLASFLQACCSFSLTQLEGVMSTVNPGVSTVTWWVGILARSLTLAQLQTTQSLARGWGHHSHFACMRKHTSFLKTQQGTYSTPVSLGLHWSPSVHCYTGAQFITPVSLGW